MSKEKQLTPGVWKPDPLGRPEVEKVSDFLELPVFTPQTFADFIKFWNEVYAKIDTNAKGVKAKLDTKLDKGTFTGNADDLQNFDNAIWGGEFAGYIQDATIKEVGKRYIDKFDKKAYECIKVGSNINTTEFYKECTVKGNLEKIQNLVRKSEAGYVFIKNNSEFLGDIVIEKVGSVTVVASSFYNSVAESAVMFKVLGKKCIACTASVSNGGVKIDKLVSGDGFSMTPSLSSNTIHFIMYLV